MLLPSRVAGRTVGLRGPDMARGPEVARLCLRSSAHVRLDLTLPRLPCLLPSIVLSRIA